MPVLEIRDLTIRYETKRGGILAVENVSFALEDGDYLGLVGESGCGKSTIAKAIMRILPPNGSVAGGEIRFRGEDLVAMPKARFRRILWKEIALVPQSAMHSFDPVYRIGAQIVEAIRAHEPGTTKAEALERAKELFRLVGLDVERLDDYPHQFSGGMRQRGMIAMAMALDPTVVIADEPTTALDVIVQDQIMGRIKEIHERSGKTMLLIAHDIALVAESCNKVVVMYAGRVVEHGGRSVLGRPSHPYTIGLANAFLDIEDTQTRLISIPGAQPDLVDPPRGCRFHERCPFRTPRCVEEEPALRPVPDGDAFAACHYIEEAVRFRDLAKHSSTWQGGLSNGPIVDRTAVTDSAANEAPALAGEP